MILYTNNNSIYNTYRSEYTSSDVLNFLRCSSNSICGVKNKPLFYDYLSDVLNGFKQAPVKPQSLNIKTKLGHTKSNVE